MSNSTNTGYLSEPSNTASNTASNFIEYAQRIERQISQAVYDYVDPDPVKSFIRADRCGPNPNPEWCYLQKTKTCENTRM